MTNELKDLLQKAYDNFVRVAALHKEYTFASLDEREQMMNEYIEKLNTSSIDNLDTPIKKDTTMTNELQHIKEQLAVLTAAVNRLQCLLPGRPTPLSTNPPAPTTFDFGDGPVLAHRHVNPDGSLGGWVADTATVEPTAYVGPDARVYENAQVFGDAQVYENAQVFGDARVYGKAQVYGRAWVFGTARVFGDARVYGNAQVFGDARVRGTAVMYEGKIN
jgi:hypothetical protein